MHKIFCCVFGLFLALLLSACGTRPNAQQLVPSQPIISDAMHVPIKPTPTPQISIPSQMVTPTKVRTTPGNTPSNFPGSGSGSAPWGPPPPLSAEEIQLTQQLFALINHDRAVRGLYPFIWNNTLAEIGRAHV